MAKLTWTESKKIDTGPSKGKVIEWISSNQLGWQFTLKPPFGRRRKFELTSKIGADKPTAELFDTADEAKAAAEAR